MFNGEAGGGGAVLDAELAIDRAEMRFDGVRRKEQALGHLGVGEALCDEAQHLDLARGESGGEAWGSGRWCGEGGEYCRQGVGAGGSGVGKPTWAVIGGIPA